VQTAINLRSGVGVPIRELRSKPTVIGGLKRRDDTSLDLLAGLSGGFARSSVFPAGLIEVGNESVAFDGCGLKQGQRFFESLSGLLYLINEGSSVH
jgi:hypothetical protein